MTSTHQKLLAHTKGKYYNWLTYIQWGNQIKQSNKESILTQKQNQLAFWNCFSKLFNSSLFWLSMYDILLSLVVDFLSHSSHCSNKFLS